MKPTRFEEIAPFTYEAKVEGWREDEWLLVDVKATQRSLSQATFSFFEPGKAQERFCVRQKFMPGLRVRVGFPLACLKSKSTFLPPMPGQYKSGLSGEPTSIGKMEKVRLSFRELEGLKQVEIYGACVTDAPEFPVEGGLLVDAVGQIATKDWPGKTAGPEELTAYLRARRREAKDAYPQGFSRYGGWLEKRFDQTGYFHTHHDGRRWWLVDPDGYAFLSNGPCYGARMGIYNMLTGVESLCQELPDRQDPLYAQAYMTADRDPEFAKRNGSEAGKDRWMVNFTRINMMRAFGEDWWNAWAEINGSLLKSWGMNTLGVGVGNYPDERTYDYIKKVRIPFVLSLIDFPKPDNCIFRDFPDVFDPLYVQLSAQYAKQLLPYREEPLLIGYFLTNEPEWLFQPVALSKIMLLSQAHFFSKDQFLDRMRQKYGEICKLNAAWGADFADFDALCGGVAEETLASPSAQEDLTAFDQEMIERYAAVPSQALREIAPHHLNLGMRFSHFEPRAMAGAKDYDVFSFNCYQTSCVPKAGQAYAMSHLPLMVGEWHICGYDRGLLGSGLVQAKNQEERAKAIRFYTEQAFADPNVVGIHYFELFDQPPLGRFDGATGQSGLIDVCNKPYPECAEALMAAGRRLYPVADGQLPPYDQPGEIDDQRVY